MSRFQVLVIALLALAVSGAALADDAPPTTQEMAGYALSLAGNAYHGDRKSLETLQSRAALGDPGAQFGLGEYFLLSKDYPQSVSWFRKSSAQGFAGGYLGLGNAYESGLGVPRDDAMAMRMYLKATELAEARMDIGQLYAHGKGVPQDLARAVAWYTKAANAGSIAADLALGSAYESGSGVRRDDTLAMGWYRKAADLGNAAGEYHVGRIYQHPGSLHDDTQAVRWFGKAAQQGVAEAQLDLGMMYLTGKGVPADAAHSVQLFQMSANQGNGHAQFELADRFATGTGIPRDAFRAFQWMAIARSSLDGTDPMHSIADAKLKDLERQLGAAQSIRATRAAADWLRHHGEENKAGALAPTPASDAPRT